MLKGRAPLTRRALAVALLGMLALDGCAAISHPAGVPTKGQDGRARRARVPRAGG